MSVTQVIRELFFKNLKTSASKLIPFKAPLKKRNKPTLAIVIGIGQNWRMNLSTDRKHNYNIRVSEAPKVNENTTIWSNFDTYDYSGVEPEYMMFKLIYNENFRNLARFDKQFSSQLTFKELAIAKVLKMISRMILEETESQEYIKKLDEIENDFSNLEMAQA